MTDLPTSPLYVAFVADRVQFVEDGSNGIQSLQISTSDFSHVLILMRSIVDPPGSLHFHCDHGCSYDAITRAELSATGLSLSLRSGFPLATKLSGYQIAWSLAGSQRERITHGLASLFRDTDILHPVA